MKIRIDGERPMTWNTFYSGRHWSVRKKEADRVHERVVYATLGMEPIKARYAVAITVHVFFDKRPFDPDNIPAKLYIDGLRAAGILPDDTMKYVTSVTTVSHKSSDGQSYVEIVVECDCKSCKA